MVVHSAQVYIQLKPLFSRHNGIGVQFTDEPTGALDSNTGKEILEMFKELNAMGNTIIQISHDINVAKAGKRIVHLKDGIMEE